MNKLRLIKSNLIHDLTKLSAYASSIYWVSRNTELKILVGNVSDIGTYLTPIS